MSWNLARKKINSNENEGEHSQHFQSIDSLINFKEGEEPDFYDMVMTDTYLNTKSKTDFIKKFWNKYKKSKNIEFRKLNVGKYLFWLNKEFIGIIDSIDNVDDYGDYNDNKFVIQISNDYETAFSKYVIKNNINDISDDNIVNLFKVNVKLSNKENPKPDDAIFDREMIIDTGCSITDLAIGDYWDFVNLTFKEVPTKWPFTSLCRESQILEWNNNNKTSKKVKLVSATGNSYTHKIFFRYPLYIKIGNLKSIAMYSLNIPLEKPKNDNNLLLGLDYLHNIKMTLEPSVDEEKVILKLEDW